MVPVGLTSLPFLEEHHLEVQRDAVVQHHLTSPKRENTMSVLDEYWFAVTEEKVLVNLKWLSTSL